jgi:hypothetical protein
MAKLFGSETLVRITDETLQIRGGRGYEREESLAARGEIPFPVERIFRDARINTIVEGTSEIMRLFIAREALDPHLKRAGALVDPHADSAAKTKAALSAAAFYPGWYATRWLAPYGRLPGDVPGVLGAHLRFVQRASRRLSRELFHAMVRIGPKLERRQTLLGRFVDVGVELFAMSATISRASSRVSGNGHDGSSVELADHFCRMARRRVHASFDGVHSNDDASARAVARGVLEGHYAWLEKGIVPACTDHVR